MRRPEPSHSAGSPRRGFPARPSAPILLVVAAVVLIAMATELSTVGIHTSVPSSVDLPPVAARPLSQSGADPGPPKATRSGAPRAEGPASSSTTSSPAGSAAGAAPAGQADTGAAQGAPVPPTAVIPEYPIGPGSGPAQDAATPADPSRSTTVAPTEANRGTSPPQSSTTSVADPTDDTTQTVPPYYPVVTTPSGTTTTTTVPASTSPTTDH